MRQAENESVGSFGRVAWRQRRGAEDSTCSRRKNWIMCCPTDGLQRNPPNPEIVRA